LNKKSRFFIFFPLFLTAFSLAITQESPAGQGASVQSTAEALDFDDPEIEALAEEEIEIPPEPLPEWIKPERWFRSNSAGMALEETDSRFAALRNKYALVIDFVSPDELPELLSPFFKNGYYIEVHALYKNGEESRRQWIFRDENGMSRLVSVFNQVKQNEPEKNVNAPNGSAHAENETDGIALNEAVQEEEQIAAESAADTSPDEIADSPYRGFNGFIEVYKENFLLERDILFSEDFGERETAYFYRNDVLLRAEATQNGKKIFTDNYRYNRSGSLRTVERLYHETVDESLVRLSFPSRVLDAAEEENFIGEKLYLTSDTFGDYEAEADQRMIFNTDERGRILTQTLLDQDGNEVWVIKNTWSGDRISSILKTEGEDQWLNEYIYNSADDLIMERNLHNGVLERQVRIKGNNETEELIINGLIVLRAEWEDGRKISEQRVRTGEKAQ
jgi:antitoxin component YwqK of YwqJK toxin-antitoxin module